MKKNRNGRLMAMILSATVLFTAIPAVPMEAAAIEEEEETADFSGGGGQTGDIDIEESDKETESPEEEMPEIPQEEDGEGEEPTVEPPDDPGENEPPTVTETSDPEKADEQPDAEMGTEEKEQPDAETAADQDEQLRTGSVIDQGSYGIEGEGLETCWSLSSDGTLALTGNYYIYELSKAPWKAYKEQIRKIDVDVVYGEGNEYYTQYPSGNGNFSGYPSVEEISLRRFAGSESYFSLTFTDDSMLKTIYFGDIRWPEKPCTISFKGCSSLNAIDLSGQKLSVGSLSNVFTGCKSVRSIDISGIDVSAVTTMQSVFSGLDALETINIGEMELTSATSLSAMFNGCAALTEIKGRIVTSEACTNVAGLFSGCSSLQYVDVSGLDTQNCTLMGSMFDGCCTLESLDVSTFDTSSATSMAAMFRRCSALTALDVSHFQTGNVTNFADMFSGCSSLKYLDLSNFIFNSKCKYIGSMLNYCAALETLDLGFDAAGLTELFTIAEGFDKLNKIYLPYNFNVSFSYKLPLYDNDFNKIPWYLSDGSVITAILNFPYSRVVQRGSVPDSAEDRMPMEIEGNWGNVLWSLEDGVLYLSSAVEGAEIPNIGDDGINDVPWSKYQWYIWKIVIGEHITSVGDYVFSSYPNIKSVEMTEGIVSIGKGAFQNCTKLKECTISPTVTEIGALAFSGNVSLQTIVIPENVEIIRESLFQDCTGLRTVTIPADIKGIEINAFFECRHLEGIRYGGTRSQWDAIELGTGIASQLRHCIIWFADGSFYQKTAYDGEFSYINSMTPEVISRYKYACEFTDFLGSSYDYKHALTQMSVRVAMSAMGTEDGTGTQNIEMLMDDMGFYYSEKSVCFPKPDGNTIGYAIGSRKIVDSAGMEHTLVLAAVRGGGYGNEWAGNFNIGMGTHHEGFDIAANTVKRGLDDFLKSEEITADPSVHIWICGYSRGAATSNLLAAKLDNGEIAGIRPENVHAFCFECPQNTTDKNAHADLYANIVNVVNPVDLVPMVAPDNNFLWKYTRYGQTNLLPSYNNTVRYFALKEKMQDAYESIFQYRGEPFDKKYVDVSFAQSEQFQQAVSNLTELFESPEEYVAVSQDALYNALYAHFSGQSVNNVGEIWDCLWKTLLLYGPVGLKYHLPQIIAQTSAIVVANVSRISYAHYPELCLAWVDSLDGEQLREARSYQKVYINCPVNAEVYEDGTLVGAIYKDIPQEIVQGVEAYIDDDGQKVFVLPGDGSYTVEITAYEQGEVTYTVESYEDSVTAPEKVTSYYKNAVTDGSQMSGVVKGGEISLRDKGGNILTPDVEQQGDDIHPYTVEISVEGDGTVEGGGIYNPGNYAKVIALESNGTEFIEWRIDGSAVSTDKEYRFLVDGDKKLIAVFTETPEGLWISGIDEEGYSYTGAAIKPEIKVYDGEILLTEKTDYTVSYANNTNVADKEAAKAPVVKVKGRGNYKGEDSVTFTIHPKFLQDEDVLVNDIAAVKANGKAQQPVVSVKMGKKKLVSKRDYTVSCYSDEACTIAAVPKESGTYYVKISGKGNYDGDRTLPFVIADSTQKLVSKLSVGKIKNKTYSGLPVELTPDELIVKDGKTILTAGKEYTVTYSSNHTDIGTVTVTITGDGKTYAGSKAVTFQIVGTLLSKAEIENLTNAFTYDGKDKVQDTLKLKYNGTEIKGILKSEYMNLSPEQRPAYGYTIEYQNNIKAGVAKIVLRGINAYSGTVTKTYKITPFDISEDHLDQFKVATDGNIIYYSKAGAKPEPIVTFNGTTLTRGTDYTVSWSNNMDINDGTGNKVPLITVKGKGNFKGIDRTTTFVIAQRDIGDGSVRVEAPDKVFSAKRKAWKASVTVVDTDGRKLSAGADYEKTAAYTYKESGEAVADNDIVSVGATIVVTVIGKGKYTGTVTGEYRIAAKDIGKVTASVEPKTYTGKSIMLSEGDITFKSGRSVLKDVTYIIDEASYKNNVKKGKATVIIKGTGEYGGTKKITYTIGSKGFLWWWRNLSN